MRPLLGSLMLVAACGSADEASSVAPPASSGAPPAAASAAASAPAPTPAPIGDATLEADGTLVLNLRRPALAQRRIKPSDKDYKEILEHVGPIKPGETKLVAPWPEAFDEKKAEDAARAWAKTKKDWGGEPAIEVVGTRNKDVVVNVTSKAKRRQVTLDPKTYAVKDEAEF